MEALLYLAGHAVGPAAVHTAASAGATAAHWMGWQWGLNALSAFAANPGVASGLGAAAGVNTAASIASREGLWIVNNWEKLTQGLSEGFDELTDGLIKLCDKI